MQQVCAHCSQEFDIADEDLVFYDKVSPVFEGKKFAMPPPTNCPDCRLQRRLSRYNESNLFRRKCDATQTLILSIHPPEVPYPVYANHYWWSDAWDAKAFGQDIDFSKPFFDQFHELFQRVPQLAIVNDNGVRSENCEYCQNFSYGSNCYLVFGSWDTHDSYYSNSSDHCKNVVDTFFVNHSELCYECVESMNLYNCKFLRYSENCSDCMFGEDLIGCKDCFCCYGLRQKRYFIFNEQKSEEEYKRFMSTVDTSKFTELQKVKERYDEWSKTKPRRHMFMKNCENSKGECLFNSKDAVAFNVYNAEGVKFCDRSDSPVLGYDIFQSGKNTLCYECVSPDESHSTLFSHICWKGTNVLYSDSCHSCKNCFGCISLKRDQYCILNKQYTQEEYERLAAKLAQHMQSTGEWGEYFPITHSPYGYNITVASEFTKLQKSEVQKKKWKWRDDDGEQPKVEKIIPAEKLPEAIDAIPDDILNWAITCPLTQKPYRITPQELNFYRRMRLPIPRVHPDERHRARLAKRSGRKFWDRNCMKCEKKIETTYAPERPETVYCEECYLKEVY